MSNYPPGVTGNEPAIAGYPEGAYSAPTCEGYMPEGTKVAPTDIIERLMAIQTKLGEGDIPFASYRLGQLTGEIMQMPNAIDQECGYEGSVDAQWDGDRKGNGTFFWTCPRCGTENEEHREAGDDHPDL